MINQSSPLLVCIIRLSRTSTLTMSQQNQSIKAPYQYKTYIRKNPRLNLMKVLNLKYRLLIKPHYHLTNQSQIFKIPNYLNKKTS